MTGINGIGNARNFGFPQNKAQTNTLADGNKLPPNKIGTVGDASSQFNLKITDISADTLARVGDELHSKGQIDAETHLMMTLPRLGSAAMHVGGLPSDAHVLGGHIGDPKKNIDMLQFAKDKLDYINMVNEKHPLQRVDTKPWEGFIDTLKKLDGKEISAFSPTAEIALSLSSRQTPTTSAANIVDTVTISQAARKALSSSESSLAHTDAYPLEYYSIPQWQADLMPVVLSGKLGGIDRAYERGGNLVGGEFDSKLAEYSKLFDSHLKTILQDKGITTTPEFHQAMVVSKESSESIRVLMKESIAGDSRMMDLMKTLGIPLPT